MGLKKWMEGKIKKMNMCDMSCIKLGSAAFALMVAKLWQPLLSLNWYWYLIIALAATAKPCYKLFTK